MYAVCPAQDRGKQERTYETDYSISWAKILLFSELCKSCSREKVHFMFRNMFSV